jgi:hypothetical protein
MNWSDDDVVGLALWEPRRKNIEIFLSFWCPCWKPFFDFVGGQTETDEVVVLHVIGHLVVHHSSLLIVEGVLLILSGEVLWAILGIVS